MKFWKEKLWNGVFLLCTVMLCFAAGGIRAEAAVPSDAEKWCGHYYRLYENMDMTPEEAADYCATKGGYLATYSSSGEKNLLEKLLPTPREGENYLIGNSERYHVVTTKEFGLGDNRVGIATYPHWYTINEWTLEKAPSNKADGFLCEWGDPISMSADMVNLSQTSYIYTGNPQKPEVKVWYDGIELEPGTAQFGDYNVTVSGDITNIGKVTINVQGFGRFQGKVTQSYTILPPAPKNLTARCEDGRNIRTAWRASAGYVTGYEVEYSEDLSFLISEKAKVTNGAAVQTTGYLLEDLHASDSRFFRVRAYKTVNNKNYYSEWSNSVYAVTDPELSARDFWGFGNFSGKITKKYFERYFGKEQAKILAKNKTVNGTNGVCFGMNVAALATLEKNSPSLSSYGLMGVEFLSDITSSGKRNSALGMSARDYIYYAQAFLQTAKADEELSKHFGKLRLLYDAVKRNSKLSRGVAIRILQIDDSGKDTFCHSIVALGILSESSREVQIKIYDPNEPRNEKKVLHLYRTNSSLTFHSWEYQVGSQTLTGRDGLTVFRSGEKNDVITFEEPVDNFLEEFAENSPEENADLVVSVSAGSKSFDVKKALKKKDISFLEPIQTNGSGSGTSGIYFVRQIPYPSFTLENVPKGSEITVAAPYHSVTVKTGAKADLYFDVDDIADNFVSLDMKENGSYSVVFSDSSADSEITEVTTVKGSGKKGVKATVYQRTNYTVEIEGSTSLSITKQKGKENDIGELVNPVTENITVSKLSTRERYQYSLQGKTSVIKKEAGNREFSVVVASSVKPKKGTTFQSGNLQYRITKVTGAGGNVTLVKTVKKTAEVKIPDTVQYKGYTYRITEIGAKAFGSNTKVKKIMIGKYVTTIGSQAFLKAKNLRSITIKSLSLKKVGKSAFSGIYKKAVIKVPSAKYADYTKLLKKKGQASGVKIVKS
ncbi:MAG: leucine-rich repeat protein [Candidatus Limivivens sp.]|nr:leucine-rich repeat protein [Candidatus Limivivens sp.]